MSEVLDKESLPRVDRRALEQDIGDLDPVAAARTYDEYGCLIVRGMMRAHVDAIHRDIEEHAAEAVAQMPQARQIPEGWITTNSTLCLPAPEGFGRDKQIMVLGLTYRISGAFLRSAFDDRALSIVTSILGSNVELFGQGQCLYKEPGGGHPKMLHQDAGYFEHALSGPVAILNYVEPTNETNGCLHVIPGSHKLGMLEHVDTFSHLGLDEDTWPWEASIPICGEPGDSIFFNVKTIHGSKQNFSSTPRPVFIHRYRGVDDYTVAGGTMVANRSERDAEKGKSSDEAGLMVSGYRMHKPEKGD